MNIGKPSMNKLSINNENRQETLKTKLDDGKLMLDNGKRLLDNGKPMLDNDKWILENENRH